MSSLRRHEEKRKSLLLLSKSTDHSYRHQR
jgi:hypothetical protein